MTPSAKLEIKQRKDVLLWRIGLSKHSCCSLLEYLLFSQVCSFSSKVCIFNSRYAFVNPSKRKKKKKKNKKFESTWNFSIYNVYSRKNPYFIYFALEGLEEDGENQNIQNGNVEPKAYQVSIFPILPSVTWNFNF